MAKHLTILEKAQMASYEVAYLIAKDKNSHSIGESLIKPAAIAISQIMSGDKVTEEIKLGAPLRSPSLFCINLFFGPFSLTLHPDGFLS